MTNNKIKQKKWDLSDIIKSPEGEPLKELLTSLENSIKEIEAIRPKLNNKCNAQTFNFALEHLQNLSIAANRLGSYAGLWFSENTQNQSALSFQAKIEQIITEANNRALFLMLWWKHLPDKHASLLIHDAPETLQYYLEYQRKESPHVLEEQNEQIVNIKNINGTNALTTIYAMITNKYTFDLSIGQTKKTKLTRDALMNYVRDPNAKARKMAYQELYRVYENDGIVLSQIYKNLVQDWYEEYVKLRKHPTPISVRNLSNDIPNEVTKTLLSVCRENTHIFQRWFKIKARILSLKQLNRYDIYAPINSSITKYPYAESVELVLNTFEEFSPKIAAAARQIFKENHIDSENRNGKRGGAFCASIIPSITPYVLINYGGSIRDVATLAHELGHAVHSMISNNHSVLTYHSTLPLAETASTFSEMLLIDKLLESTTDNNVKQDIIANSLDDNYATIMRQAYFTIFEQKAHEMIENHSDTDDLNEAYLKNLEEQFGDSVKVNSEFKWEWISIPHIYYTPFYCYSYSFGQLLVLALYQRYKEIGSKFIPQYIQILEYGSSKSPQYILEKAGIDISSPKFWQGGFNFINKLIDEVENTTQD
ncbi:MAG TPA: oligoendopeptidase F [Chloroflexi bacterium]|nr:oligoendopeptidase F [Chloroflexota bacterium]|tara:strand:- start:3035 stop:4819 length:1785 start_codon:yes stop_codon:yes gene_type:complete